MGSVFPSRWPAPANPHRGMNARLEYLTLTSDTPPVYPRLLWATALHTWPEHIMHDHTNTTEAKPVPLALWPDHLEITTPHGVDHITITIHNPHTLDPDQLSP